MVEQIDQPDFLAHVRAMGQHLAEGLATLAGENARIVAGHRGMGLMQGLRLQNDQSLPAMVEAARTSGLLTVAASDQTLRLLPPLTVSAAEIDRALICLKQALKSLKGG